MAKIPMVAEAKELISHLGRYFSLKAKGINRVLSQRLKSLQLQYEMSHTSTK